MNRWCGFSGGSYIQIGHEDDSVIMCCDIETQLETIDKRRVESRFLFTDICRTDKNLSVEIWHRDGVKIDQMDIYKSWQGNNFHKFSSQSTRSNY